MASPPLPAELVYHQLKILLEQRKVLEAHRLWETSVEENPNGWGGLEDYSKTASSMRREEMLLRSAFADVSESKKGKILEQYQNHADFLKIEYRHIPDDTFIKICAEFTGGELNILEMVTLMRDIAMLPRVNKMFKVGEAELYTQYFATSAMVKVDSYYPRLLMAPEQRVYCSFFDCINEHGAVVVSYTWGDTKAKTMACERQECVNFIFYPCKQKMCVHVVVKANAAKFKMSTDWMDRNFICFNLHNNVLAMVDLARRMQLFDPELSDTMKRMWQKGGEQGGDVSFQPGKYDSDFYTWLHAVANR